LSHFNGVATYCAMNANMYAKGVESALRLRTMFSTDYRSRLSNAYFQYLDMMPLFVCVRSGKWSAAMAQPAADSSLHYAVLLDNFGKGLASLRLHDVAAARLCLQRLRSLLKDSLLQIRIMPFNRPVESAKIAESLLAGEIAFSEGKSDEALRSLGDAVSGEDKLIYSEPKYWPIPARHFLGACLLALRRPAEAEAVYRKDLVFNHDNGWSLLGLYQSLISQGKTKEAEEYRGRYRHAFADAEEMPPGSVY
jgi:tetratricopeptide (TPR) repeat protein